MSPIVLTSELTCPECGFKKTEHMPLEFCQWFYDCPGCHRLLKPLAGDCCVFCSYGSERCPPVQRGGMCC
ncbi:GDCCVxC domain-containing (seleno)protein [Litorivivens sp.]|uniref:GDCCVxC domain-containing (seleno)protein n=1 Tax=Litorivivens sp. TaxID=2020868 RepID=UPI0029B75BC4|nr:GDCCVxC domain-containing (seleno)protein [Oleiphilaceae bacterium]